MLNLGSIATMVKLNHFPLRWALLIKYSTNETLTRYPLKLLLACKSQVLWCFLPVLPSPLFVLYSLIWEQKGIFGILSSLDWGTYWKDFGGCKAVCAPQLIWCWGMILHACCLKEYLIGLAETFLKEPQLLYVFSLSLVKSAYPKFNHWCSRLFSLFVICCR